MRIKPRSLRKRLLLYMSVAAVIVFLLTEMIFLEKNRRSLVKMLDKTAEACALNLAALPLDDPDEIAGSNSFDEIMRDFGGHSTRVYFLVLQVYDNQEIKRSESLKNVNLSLPQPLSEFPREEAFFWNAQIHGKSVRFVGLRQAATMEAETGIADEGESRDAGNTLAAPDASQNEYVYIIGLSERYIGKRLRDTFEVTGPILGTGLALMLLLGWIVINRGLEPLRHLELEVDSISPSSMTPVTVPDDKELASIAKTLNTTIGDLKEAFERERRFAANVAHELRTRISEMRSLSEVALRLEENQDEHNRKNYEDILASAKEMQKIVTNLLTLARCHSGQLNAQNDTVALAPLINTIWNEYTDKASARGIAIRGDVSSDLVIATDKDLFATLLHNLFSNAVSYTVAQGSIEWKSGVQNDEFIFSISNSVKDLTENDLHSMFEPFWQKDEARTPGDNHCGLGLALVRSVAEVLGLSVKARLTTPTSLTVTLTGKQNQSA